MAPALLGPSPAERIAVLEMRADQLAERNRLARELHDSIGACPHGCDGAAGRCP
jgi:hypothetical protein